MSEAQKLEEFVREWGLAHLSMTLKEHHALARAVAGFVLERVAVEAKDDTRVWADENEWKKDMSAKLGLSVGRGK